MSVNYLQDFIESLQVVHHDVSVFIKDRHRDKELELAGQEIREQHLPQSHNIHPFELPLEPDEKPTEAKEQIQRFAFL